ncbi:lipid phosphate phosphatase-related protein type 1-like [Platysternon megacephalum]|uniref:Lipid phosphate phosphatase-related protein type 1-like n=1 Tax=Platysternon megacephalum TaxID=55544 RepID=A0A4D9EFP3_9SAUR|nr:lipid phosphate phosphatase-related protein type 1-like [Platysternon megacephalum]
MEKLWSCKEFRYVQRLSAPQRSLRFKPALEVTAQITQMAVCTNEEASWRLTENAPFNVEVNETVMHVIVQSLGSGTQSGR